MTATSHPVAPPRHRAAPATSPWLLAAIVASAAAGGLHVLAAAEHRAAVVSYLFLLVALAQLATAVWLAVQAVTGLPPRTLPVLGIALATASLVLLFVVAQVTTLFAGLTEVSSLPGTGAAGHDHTAGSSGEPARWLGSATVLSEFVLLVALSALLPARVRRRTVDAVLVVGIAAWALWLFGAPE